MLMYVFLYLFRVQNMHFIIYFSCFQSENKEKTLQYILTWTYFKC